jgi:hypothetical protein
MKKLMLFIMISALLICTDAQSFQLGGKELIKSGTGSRTKTILGTIYFATLYITQELKGKPAKEVIEADQPLSMVMQIDSRLLTRERFLDAVNEGFGRASESGYPAAKKDVFLKLFDVIEIKKGNIITLNYVPGEGVTAQYKSHDSDTVKVLGTIPGLDFKKALFAIWLGPKPVQESLKKALLGN